MKDTIMRQQLTGAAIALVLLLGPAMAAGQGKPDAAIMPVPLPPPVVVGGWQAIALPGSHAELRRAARLALTRIPRRNPQLARIDAGEQQIVAGTNYRFSFRLRDGTRWRAQVWRKLDGTMQLTSIGLVI